MDKPKEFWILESRCSMPLRTFYSEEDSFDEMQINDNHIHVIEYSAYEQLHKRFEEAVEVIKIIDINFNKITKCPDNTCDGCHEDAKIAAEYSSKFLRSLDKGEL